MATIINNCCTPLFLDFIKHQITKSRKWNFNYPMGKELEGLMVFFPAVMNHLVYPFYDSTEPRISVAGNMAWM